MIPKSGITRPLTIIVFVWDFFGGGAERVAVTLANAFRAAGHEVCVVAGRESGPNRDAVRPDVPVLVPPSPSSRAVLAHLRRVLLSQQPDVLLSHQTTRNVLAILAHFSTPGRLKRLIVGVEHGEMAYTARQTKSRGQKAYFHLARLLYPFASDIVAVSDNVGASVRTHLKPIRIRPTILPNPVIFPGLYEQAEKSPSHPFLRNKSGPVFVAIGRLEEQKNYGLLLEAFRLLRRTTPARLVVFGEGGLRAPLEAQRAALGLEGCVDFPGYTDNPFAAMRVANALVLPSAWEGLPTVAIEALACGTQVVSTDNSQGIQTILANRRFGWITPKGDAESLAAAMAEALATPRDPASLKRRAQDFEASRVAAIYLDHFRRLAGAGR